MSSEPAAGDRLSRAAIRRRIDEMIEAEGQVAEETDVRFPDEARVWLALTPGWTERLAESCGFPGVEGEARPLFQQMLRLGLLSVYEVDQEPHDVVAGGYYVMNAASRAEVLRSHLYADRPPRRLAGAEATRPGAQSPIVQELRSTGRFGGETTRGATELLSTAAEIGRRVKTADQSIGTPPELRRWCALAEHAEAPGALEGAFDHALRPLVASGDAAGIRDWIETARPLAALLEYTLDIRLSTAIGRAGRALELLKRRQADFRRLVAFHRREEQVEAVRQLLEGPDDRWALHFIGPGGVGKTMIIRYITCLLAGVSDSPCSADANPFRERVVVARVDFDYLNLDYPRLHPGLLLDHLAQELRAAGNARANRLFDDAASRFEEVREQLKVDGYRVGGRPSAHPLVIEGVRRYVDALRQFDERVLLVLDTCEELIKADPGGGLNTTLEETFRMLRALHDGADTLVSDGAPGRGGVDRLRVIFSGRRLLAGGGDGWSSPDSTLPLRPYLRLQEIRGFSHQEARVYLELQRVPAELIDAVVRASSPDIGTGIRIDPPQASGSGADDGRCNPHKLRLIMQWALEERRPDAAELLSAATGNYVELRIIQRLRDPELTRILPVAAVLGHFDAQTLGEAAGLSSDAAERLFEELANQEWTGTHRSGDGGAQREILDVVPSVRDAIVTYFAERGEPSELERARAAAAMATLTLDPERDLGTLEWTDWDAALRAMEHDPSRGAEWWEQAERRLFSERDPEWVLELLAPLTEKDGAARPRDPSDGPDVPPESRLRPLVLASQARAWLHTGRVNQLPGIWREVAEKARARLDSPAFVRLYRRALAGQVAARSGPGAPSAELVDELWRAWSGADEPLGSAPDAAALVAALETLVDAAELIAEGDPGAARALLAPREAGPDGPASPAWLADIEAAEWAGPDRPGEASGLLAYSWVLAGRALRLAGRPEASLRYLRRALERAPSLSSGRPPRGWADWVPPADLAARLRLEFARAAYPALLSASETLDAVETGPAAPTSAPSADVDRLQSMLLQLRLAVGGIAVPAGTAATGADPRSGVAPLRQGDALPAAELANAHRLVPPEFVSACQLLAAGGLIELALEQLRSVVDNRRRFDREAVWHVERARLHLVRRLRLNEEGESTETTLADSSRIDDVGLIWSLTGQAGPTLPDGSFVAGPADSDWRTEHRYWQACYAVDSASALTTVTRGRDALVPARDQSRVGDDLDFGQASINLDLVELRLVTEAHRLELSLEPPELYRPCFDPLRWSERHAEWPTESLTLILRSWALDRGEDEAPVPAELIGRLGTRRAAELAFELAEQLALRLPRSAISLLEWADRQFHYGGDPLGELLAATLALFLQPRPLGDAAEATRLRGAAQAALPAYDAFRSSLTSVEGVELPPEREHLERLAEAPSEEGLDALGPRALRPWLVRLVAGLIRARELPASPPAASEAALRSWVERRYGGLVGSELRLPTEWSHFFAARAGGRVPSPAQATERPAPAVVGGDVSGSDASRSVVIAGGSVSGSVVVTQREVWSTRRVGSAGRLLGRLLPARLRSRLATLRRVELDIRPADAGATHKMSVSSPRSTASPAREVRIESRLWTVELVAGWPPYRSVMTAEAAVEPVAVDELDSYRTLARAAPQALVQALVQESGALGGLPMSVWLRPQSGLHGVCWEALLALALPAAAAASPGELPLWFCREVEASRPPLGPLDGPHVGVSLTADELASAVVRRALPRRDPAISLREVAAPGADGVRWSLSPAAEGAGAAAHVLHLIGSVVPEGSSVALRLSPERSYSTQIGTPTAQSVGGRDQRGRMLRPGDLRRLYPEIRVCVLQGYPDEGTGSRDDSDRQTAALARLFAAETAREGIAVIVIPPLEPTPASRALEQLNEAMSSYLRRGIASLHPTLAEMRSTIVQASPDRESGWELALDLCVYDTRPPSSGARATPT